MIVTCAQCQAKNRIPAKRLADPAHCGRCKAAIALDVPVVTASAAEFDELLAESPLPVVVDFWASWCGPCLRAAPELEKLAKDRAGRVVVAKLDTEAVPDVAARYGIRSIPAFIAFRGGLEAKRAVGAMRADDLARALGV